MKKFRIIIAMMLLIFTVLGAMTAHAAMDATAKVTGPENVRLGDTFTVAFKVSCAEDVYGMTANITESGPISRKEIKLSSALDGWSKTVNDSNGNIMLYDETFTNAFSGTDETMFTVTYTVTDSAKAGDSISIAFNNIELSNLEGQTEPFAATYTKTVGKKLNSNTNLTSIKVDGTALGGFDYNTTQYQLTVPYTTSSLSITASPAGEGATYTVSGNSDLKFGVNTVTVKVTAESGATKSYIIKVTRQDPPDEAYLGSLKAESYALSPAFDPSVLAYTVSVPYTKQKITVTPTAAEGITFTVEGGEKLAVGENTVTVTVTDRYEHQRTYTVTVVRRQNNNTNLLKLSVEGHTLTPAFNYTVTKYSLTVNSSVATLVVNAVVAGDGATASVAGETLGANGGTVEITVTAMDGSTKVYTIEVTRDGSGNPDDPDDPVDPPVNPPAKDGAKLSALAVKDATLNPKFSADVVSYSLTVAYGVTSVNVTAIGEDGAVVTVTGADNLKVGENTVKILVTAEGKSDTEYVIKVTRAAKPSTPDSAKLQGLNLSIGTLSPAFDADVFSYVVYLPYEMAGQKLTINAICGENAALQGGNTQDSPVLRAGENTITLRTTTTDGKGNATYKIIAYVMPQYDNKLPTISDGNESGNEGTSAPTGILTVVGSDAVGGKLTATFKGEQKNYTFIWRCEGEKDVKGASYTVTSKVAGKKVTVYVYEGTTVITSKEIQTSAPGALDDQQTGFDVIGMVLSLVGVVIALVIGFILGKMFARKQH